MKPSVGIALAGGGARGIAHIGVIRALLEHGIVPEVISGTSAGAIVGSLYASGNSPDEMMRFVKEASVFRLIKIGLPVNGLTKLTYLKEHLAKFIAVDQFEALQYPLHVAVSNLNTGNLEIINSGPLFDIVMASSSIPMVFKPVEINGQLYVDGGLFQNMPVSPLVDKADFIIAVNIMPHLSLSNRALQNVIGIGMRSFDMLILANTKPEIPYCDVLIEPAAIRRYTTYQLNKYRAIERVGYEATIDMMPVIQRKLAEKAAQLEQSASI